mmetsp:Transcript_28483/g.68514  ORF Transcript_28483/g.68514 Transcript_28483/m.68514 type:complete len:183 (+) Transcript_28483:49-597(+)
MKPCYYLALGVAQDAPKAVIRQAYRALAKKLHPDVNKTADAAQDFEVVQEAYSTLSDENKRWQYDREMGYDSVVQPKDDFATSGEFRKDGTRNTNMQQARAHMARAQSKDSSAGGLPTIVKVAGVIFPVCLLAGFLLRDTGSAEQAIEDGALKYDKKGRAFLRQADGTWVRHKTADRFGAPD